MKKYVLPILFGVLLISCSKDSESESEPTEPVVSKVENRQSIGTSAADFLNNDNFDKIHIEIVHVDTYKPTPGSIDRFRMWLEEFTFKTDIQITYKSVESTNIESMNYNKIAELENEYRTIYNQDRTLSLYMYFTDAGSTLDVPSQNRFVLGAVYYNTSMVFFQNSIRLLADKTTLPITRADVETAVIQHEFGHLFGLVNLGSEREGVDHSAEDNPNHCNEENCLMVAELNFNSDMINIMSSRTAMGEDPVPLLGPECQLDLQSLGGR